MAKIYYLMGKSSSGKDTIFKELIKNEKLNLATLVGYTTRPMREGELEGREYHFVSENEMNRLDSLGVVIEKRSYNTIHGIWNYFTVDDEQLDLKKKDYLLIGTLESYEKVRNYFGKDVVVPLYIHVDDGERLMRALKREMEQTEPKYAEMCRRFLADEKDFSQENIKRLEIDRFFENIDIKKCIEEIEKYIIAFK